jgi:hypothetical protein
MAEPLEGLQVRHARKVGSQRVPGVVEGDEGDSRRDRGSRGAGSGRRAQRAAAAPSEQVGGERGEPAEALSFSDGEVPWMSRFPAASIRDGCIQTGDAVVKVVLVLPLCRSAIHIFRPGSSRRGHV